MCRRKWTSFVQRPGNVGQAAAILGAQLTIRCGRWAPVM
jgi:hypothetical protein